MGRGKRDKKPRKSAEGNDDSGLVTDDSASTISERGGANLADEEVEDNEIIIDANREIRAKLYLGSVSYTCCSQSEKKIPTNG